MKYELDNVRSIHNFTKFGYLTKVSNCISEEEKYNIVLLSEQNFRYERKKRDALSQSTAGHCRREFSTVD